MQVANGRLRIRLSCFLEVEEHMKGRMSPFAITTVYANIVVGIERTRVINTMARVIYCITDSTQIKAWQPRGKDKSGWRLSR